MGISELKNRKRKRELELEELRKKAIKKEKKEGSNLAIKIIKESVRVLIISSIIVTIGGISLKTVEDKLLTFIPFLILLPALNKMLGDFGVIIVSRFTTMLYEKRIRKPLLHSHNLKHLFRDIFPIVIISAIYVPVLATFAATLQGFVFDLLFLIKIISGILIISVLLVLLNFFVAVIGGLYVYHKKEDPDDLLIPITTSIADLGGLILLAVLVALMF